MKVKDLIEALSRLDQEAEVEIVINKSNSVYPAAYVPIPKANWDTSKQGVHPFVNVAGLHDRARIQVWLPDGMYTVTRKEK